MTTGGRWYSLSVPAGSSNGFLAERAGKSTTLGILAVSISDLWRRPTLGHEVVREAAAVLADRVLPDVPGFYTG